MTARLLPLVTSVALAAGMLVGQSVALPTRVVACSCAAPPSIEVVAADPNVSVVLGTAGRPLPEVTPFSVELWFSGAEPSDLIMLSGGAMTVSSCDVSLVPGGRHLLVLYGEPGQVYSTSLCAPHGMLGTPEGDQLLVETQATFGEGEKPPPAEPEPEAPTTQEGSPWLDGGLVWILGAVGAAGVLFAGLALVVGRRKPV